jgi:hypothetical protein
MISTKSAIQQKTQTILWYTKFESIIQVIMNVDVSVVRDHPMIALGALGRGMSSLEISYMASSFSWFYAFGLSPVVYYERPGVRPESEYTGWTQSEDHSSTQQC